MPAVRRIIKRANPAIRNRPAKSKSKTYVLVYSEPYNGGEHIVMEQSSSYNKLCNELLRLVEKEDYPCWAMQIVNLDEMEIDYDNLSWKGLKF